MNLDSADDIKQASAADDDPLPCSPFDAELSNKTFADDALSAMMSVTKAAAFNLYDGQF